MKLTTKLTLGAAGAVLTLAPASPALAQYVVQIPVDSVLDGRSVSTFTGGVVVPYTPNQGVYSNGTTGYATAAVQMQLAKTSAGVGLPDDGFFPAANMLPPFQLHFSNAAPATSPQTHFVYHTTGPQSFQFPVPPAIYSALYLIFTSAEGTSAVTITLSYAGGVPNDVSMWNILDTGMGVLPGTGPSAHFYIATNTGKWNGTTDAEPTNHTIEGIQITPSSKGMLTGVQIAKTNAAYLVFWGATGVATTPVDAGAEMPFDSGAGSGATEGGTGQPDASTGATSGAASGAVASSGTASGASSTGVASAGTTSGAPSSGVTTGSMTAGSTAAGAVSGATGTGAGGAGTTPSGASGAASQSGTAAASSGSSATTPPSSGSSGSGCSLAPAVGTSAGWLSLAALAWLARAGRRPRRKAATAHGQGAER